MSGKFSATSIN